jgi:hypothetical protein
MKGEAIDHELNRLAIVSVALSKTESNIAGDFSVSTNSTKLNYSVFHIDEVQGGMGASPPARGLPLHPGFYNVA